MTDPAASMPPAMPRDHPRATTVFVLGILGLVLCQVCAPFAWLWGTRTLAEIDARPDLYGGRGLTNAGMIMGLIGTILLGLFLVVMVFFVAMAALGIMGGMTAVGS